MFIKIEDKDFIGNDVSSIKENPLIGDAVTNKGIFDRAAKNVLMPAINALIDALGKSDAAEQIGTSEGTLQSALNGLKDKISHEVDEAVAGMNSAIAGKVDKEEGRGLSEENFTKGEKDKLGGIEDGAQVNVIEHVQINGAEVEADGKTVKLIIPTPQEIIEDNKLVNSQTLSEGLTKKVNVDGNKVLSDNNYSDEDKAKLDGVETKMTKLWETTLTEAEIQVRPDNNDNLNLIKGKLIIDIPPITEPLGGRPVVYIGQYTGEQATTDNMASGFSTSVFKKAGECPLFMLEFEIVGSNRCITCSKTYRMGTNTGGCSVTTSGILIEKSDSDERCAVNTIHIMYEKYFPVGTKFELWGY